MRRANYLFLTLIFLQGILHAQGINPWKMLHPTPQGNLLRSINVFDANNYIAVGGVGTFVKTTDGGQTWTTRFDASRQSSTGTYGTAYGSYFFSPESGVICGTYGVTITNNGGQTFDTSITALPSAASWYNIRFIDRMVGFMAGTTSGRMAKTTDGGYTWTLNTILPSSTYYDIYPFNENRIIIVGSTTTSANVRITTDGGATWSAVAAGTGTNYAVHFIDSLTGFVSGTSGLAHKTTDGGMTWTALNSGATASLYAIKYINNTLYLIGDPQTIYKSTDLGATFTPITITAPNQTVTGTMYGLGVAGNTMVCVGNAGIINKSTDGGTAWQSLNKGVKSGQNYGVYVNPDTRKIIAVGLASTTNVTADQVIISSDFGATWQAISSFRSSSTFRSISMLNATTGFMCGTNGNIYRTTSGGVGWDSVPAPIATSVTLYAVDFVNANYGWVFGSSGTIYKTTDAGTTWMQQTAGITSIIYGADMLDTLTGYIAGASGVIMKTTDGGTTWTAQSSGTTSALYGMKMLDEAKGFIVGSSGIVRVTTDGGALWSTLTLPANPTLYAVDATDLDNVIITATGGQAFRTTNGGTAWESYYTGAGTMYSVKFASRDTAFAIGGSGTVLKYSRGGTPPSNCTEFPIGTGWNMLSPPRLAANMSAASLFPLKTSLAFTFDNGYVGRDTLQLGVAYWIRFASGYVASICGTVSPNNILPVRAGWNMIGVYEKKIPVAGITTTPPGILSSAFFGYVGGYQNADTLHPGRGYWVRTTQAGQLNLNVIAGAGKTPVNDALAGAGKLTISNEAGDSQTLYFTNEEIPALYATMPPVPPMGVFDARFSGDRAAVPLSEQKEYLHISSAIYPVTITAEGVDVHLSDNVNGKLFDRILRAGESVTLANPQLKTLSVSATRSVLTYQLFQNYPNPFNPLTVIRYSVPKQGMVSLKIYDALGSEIATLVNEIKTPGVYSVDFNASTLASGIYLYSLQTDDMNFARKMILLK